MTKRHKPLASVVGSTYNYASMENRFSPTKSLTRLFMCSSFVAATSLIVFQSAWAVTAYEAPPGAWGANSYGISFTGEYFTTKANYDPSGGSYTPIAGGNTFTTFESHLRGRYNLSSQVSFFGGSGFSSVHAVDTVNNKTNTSFTDLFVGGDYEITNRFFHIIPEVMAGYPIDHTDPNQLSPLTSDGVPYIRLGAFFYKPLKKFRIGGYLGYHEPLEALAGRALFEATFDMRVFSVFTWGFGFDGYQSVQSDNSSFATRYATDVKADAGSERFYAYNPGLLEGRLWIGYRPDKSFWVRLGYAQNFNGVNTAQGQSILMSIAYNSPRNASEDKSYEPRASKVDPDKALRGFETDVEPTEQGIFQEQEEQTEGAGPKVRKPTPPPKKAKPAKGNDNLDSTEQMLENKSKDPQMDQ